jgi:hypothetical protein
MTSYTDAIAASLADYSSCRRIFRYLQIIA